jgi:ketosteroid isomerase-like protein
MLTMNDNLSQVRAALDPLLRAGDLWPLLESMADDVTFRVATADGISATEEGGGKAAIRRYFERLGDLVTFWQVTRASNGARVVVEVEESFTIQPAGLAGGSELTLVFDLQDGVITGLSIGEGGPEPRRTSGRQGEWLGSWRSARRSPLCGG